MPKIGLNNIDNNFIILNNYYNSNRSETLENLLNIINKYPSLRFYIKE